MLRILRWLSWLVGGVLAALIIAAVATMRSGDASLYPPPGDGTRVEIFLVANFYHAGIVVPRAAMAEAARRHNLPALTAVALRFAEYPWLEFGWGDEGFYARVPTTREVTVALALRALFAPGNPSVLHVVGLAEHPRVVFRTASMVSLPLSEDGFDRLAMALDRDFARRRDGTIEEMGRGQYGQSLFYRAVGTFNALRLCNHWVADLLHAAGVPTAPVLATMPQGLFWDLSRRAGAQRLPLP